MLNHQIIDPYSCRGCDFMKNAFECALCSFLCDSETDFRTHLNAEHKSNFLPCVYCETLYNASHFLLRHLKSTHCLDAKVYRCGSVECTFKTTVLRKFLSHLDMCAGGKALRCYYCKNTFSSSNLLLLHIQGKLKILNKAYRVDKIIKIVPSPVPASVPVFQNHLNIREPKSGVPSNLDKIVQKNISAVDTLQTVPVLSSSSKKPNLLPKLIVAKPVEQTVRTYSAVSMPQEVSVTRKISHDGNNPHILKGGVILPFPPNTGKSNTFINSGSLPTSSVRDVCSPGKLANISFCQIPPGRVMAVKPSQISAVTNKTAVINANASPVCVKVENDLLKRGISDNLRTKLVTLPLVRLDMTKNVAMKNTIPNNKTHSAGFPNSSGIVVSATELPVSAGVNSTFPSFQKSAFSRNTCNVAYQNRCLKIPSKVMLISVPPPPSRVLQSGVSNSGTFKDASFTGGMPKAELCYTSANMNILPSAKQNTVKVIQSLSTKNISQLSSQSSLLFTPSSTLCELDTVSKAVPEACAKFSRESKVTEQDKLSSLDQSLDRENILSFTPHRFVDKFSTGCSERNCETSELFQPPIGLQTPTLLPVSSVMKEELTPCTDTNKTSSIPASETNVTYVKQEVISSCDAQFETAVPGLPLKSEVASNETICDRFNDYYGDIAAVVSNHSLLSQQDSNAAVSAVSDNLISGAQNFHLTSLSKNSTLSVCTSSFSEFSSIKEELHSPPVSCIDMTETSVSTSSTLVCSVKEEIVSDCDSELRTPPLSPIVTETVELSDSLFISSCSGVSLGHNDTETVSSAESEALPSPDERNSDIDVIKPAFFSEICSSHNSVFKTSSSSVISNLYKEKHTASVCHNANGSQFTLPVSSQCTKSVIADPFSSISQVLLDANSSVCTQSNSFKSVTSSSLLHLPGPPSLVDRNSVCDVTFTTLAIKPEISLHSSLSQTMLNTKCNHENSTCETASCAPVTYHSETLTGNEVCDTFSAQHSAKMFSNFVPVNLITSTFVVGAMGNKGGLGTVVSTGNEETSTAVCLAQISTTSGISICDSNHTSVKHSTVASFRAIIPKDQNISLISSDHQSSQPCITTLANNIPDPNLHNVSCVNVSETLVLPEIAENLVVKHRRESMSSCNEHESDVPCASSSSCSPDDRHPFLNSTNMTVRQILDKFRGKYKSNVNTSRKESLSTTTQSRRSIRYLTKQRVPSFNPLSPPASTPNAPCANETILEPSVVKEAYQPLPNTQHMDGEDSPVVSNKRKASQVQEVDIVKNSIPKVQKFDEHVMFTHDHTEMQPLVHYTGECSIKSEILPYTNEQSINGIFDQYCFSELESQALSDSHSNEDMCSATDILQVARELLSYNETPGEVTGEPANIFQALKRRKSEKVLKEMLRPLKLKDFFKCMARHCAYTSNICIEFSEHLKGHDAPLCSCAYCLVDFPARDNLICHLMQEHKKSLFQCSLCFYRAFSKTQVCIHFRKFHSCEKGHIISCSPVDAYPLSAFKENYMAYYANIAKPYCCCFFDCSFSCTAMLDVIHHILYCHPDCSSYVCKECEEQHSDIFGWLIHCQLHGIHLFHCIHCAFGTEARNDMLHHISMYHANESLVVFVRSSRYLMLHLEHILKHRKKTNLKNFCDISDYSSFLVKEELEIQVILENTISVDRTLKCLYCLCTAEFASEIQTHLYSKHSESDILRYFFCQSQFQTISEAELIFENLLSSYSSNKPSTGCNITLNQPSVPLQIVFVETPNGVVNLQLPLAVCKESNFSRKYTRIFRSLYDQIQSKIRRKRFKCLYCQKTERYLYKLRQHWRYCHVQTGKKFQYELINGKKSLVGSSCKAHPSICGNTESKENFDSSPASHFQKSLKFCACNHKTGETMNSNWDSIEVQSWLHCSQCDNSRNNGFKIDSLSSHQKHDNGGYCSGCALCCNSSNFLRSAKVPSEEECSFHKCNCMSMVLPRTACRIFKHCCAEITGNQVCTYDIEHKVHLKNQSSGMFKNCRLVASCYCLMKCSKKTRCFKKLKSGETDKHTNSVKLKVFLRKLPYSVKLPVLYLQQIINLNPVVVLSDIKYQHKMK